MRVKIRCTIIFSRYFLCNKIDDWVKRFEEPLRACNAQSYWSPGQQKNDGANMSAADRDCYTAHWGRGGTLCPNCQLTFLLPFLLFAC